MQTIPSFTPEQQERFAVLCAWCANGCTAEKVLGEYIHVLSGKDYPCAASMLRKGLEKKPSDVAKESWASNVCPACGALKRERKDFFCRKCFYSLDKKIQRPLLGLWDGWITQWLQAMAILKQEKKV